MLRTERVRVGVTCSAQSSNLETVQMLEHDDAFLSKAEVRSKVKLSYAEIARRQRKGTFPPSIALGPFRNSRRVFLWSSIRNWMAEQIAAALARDVSSK